MNEQERQVIDDIFRRLEQVANQPRDPEAERFIAEKLRQQPYAPYAMAQAVFVQEQALTNLQAENEQLRAELEQASRQPPAGASFPASSAAALPVRLARPITRRPPGRPRHGASRTRRKPPILRRTAGWVARPAAPGAAA